MKKTYPVSNNAKHVAAWWKHLRKEEKRRVNKSTRKILKEEAVYEAFYNRWPHNQP